MNNNIPCIYINGLSNNKIFSKIIMLFWKNKNVNLFFPNVDWFDNYNIDMKKKEIVLLAKALIDEYGKVAIIGVSAGASLAINIFNEIKEKNVSLILINGRVNVGSYKHGDKNSLYYRAKLNTNKPSQSFYDMVINSDNIIKNILLKKDKSKILIINSLIDGVVAKDLSFIDNVKKITSLSIGHNFGIFFNLIILKNKILKFINSNLHNI